MTEDLPQPAINNLDLLMQTDPLEMTKSDINDIIAYCRNHRAKMTESVGKARTKAPKVTDSKAPALDLTKLGLVKAPIPGAVRSLRRI